MIKIYEDIKTIVIIGEESHSNIYTYCFDWFYFKEERTDPFFIVISTNNNLEFLYDWKLLFRKELNDKTKIFKAFK